ncbi:YbhB/YbcL family Raf kinase inhibitor-like protein [Thiohalomonas denitrificans]|uniref:Phospholipid-binding protein, PBP family n=1 Tax=Thiohalomonas denitrificans TaxID=415747 RepID=A0A1G5PIZ8_9GAMM|nr:YbhB/YbcL family Raf kinase inhibitor-like protein [Thiohalomonas denitrificans]SCZ49386.1 phospholipid-binding protein, PBP family [Thiohalomonas denitrificans]
MSLTLQSTQFTNGGAIPSQYTCDGKDVPPPLSWSNLPSDTSSLALIMDDPDAPDPDAPQRTWVHWVVFNIPTSSDGFPEAAKQLPGNTKVGINDWQRTGYGGPCPPIGRHRYFFKLYALDIELEGLNEPTKSDLEKAMQGHILDHAELIGLYQRGD